MGNSQARGVGTSLRVRVLASFLVAIASMAGAIGFLIWQYQGVSATQALLSEGYLPLARVVDELQRDQQRVDRDVQRLLNDLPRPGTGRSSISAIYAEELDAALADARVRAERARKLAAWPEERAVLHKMGVQLDRIDALHVPYRERAAKVVALAEADRRDDALREAGSMVEEGSQLAAGIDQLSRQIAARIDIVSVEVERRRIRANAVTILLASAASLVSFALIGLVLYALAPIGRLTQEVQRVAAGGGKPIDVRGADEVAILAHEFNQMVVAIQQRDRRLSERAVELDRLSTYLASVLDALSDGLVVVEDGRITLANPAAGRMLGIQAGSSAEPGEPGMSERTTDGGRMLEVRTAPFGVGGRIQVVADVTERRLAQERLERAERLGLVGQLLAQVTHEVRNPLNALSLNAELLADEIEALDPGRTSEAREILETVSSEIERLTQVTAHYLHLARRPPTELEPEDPARILAEVARLVEPELDQLGARLAIDAEPVPPQWIDGNQLRQALLNAVRNAIEAGGRHLALTLARSGPVLEIAIRDDGDGMTDEQVAHATDPFYSTKAQGTGLGLAITRQILEDHGGTLDVRSAPGAGTTVSLRFPWRPVAAPNDDMTASLGGPE